MVMQHWAAITAAEVAADPGHQADMELVSSWAYRQHHEGGDEPAEVTAAMQRIEQRGKWVYLEAGRRYQIALDVWRSSIARERVARMGIWAANNGGLEHFRKRYGHVWPPPPPTV